VSTFQPQISHSCFSFPFSPLQNLKSTTNYNWILPLPLPPPYLFLYFSGSRLDTQVGCSLLTRSDSFQPSLTICYRSSLASNIICASPNGGVAIKHRHELLRRCLDDARERCGVNSKQSQNLPAQWHLHLFLQTAFKIRRTICIFALPGPRPVFIKTRPKIPNILNSDSYEYGCVIATPPALLHTSHESREVALEFHELSFGGISKGHPVYIDFQIDILYLKGWGSVACLRDEIEFSTLLFTQIIIQILQKTKIVGILKKMFDVLYLIPWQRRDWLLSSITI
jgi:hypothetical protein